VVSANLPQKVIDQMRKAGVPTGGPVPFRPKLMTNRKGEQVIEKRAVGVGPKQGKRGYVDDQGRVWVRDRAHADVPDHWDVQIDDGADYFRVDDDGTQLI
jgi:hypothetical protein